MDVSFWERCGGVNVVIHCKGAQISEISTATLAAPSGTKDADLIPLLVRPYLGHSWWDRFGFALPNCFHCEGRAVVYSAQRQKLLALSHASFENVQMIWNPFNCKSGSPALSSFFCPTPSVAQRDAVTLNRPTPFNKPQWQLSASCHYFRPNC